MGNVKKLIRMVFSGFVFCIAIAVLFLEAKSYNESLSVTRSKLKEDVLYQQYLSADRETVTYGELIATLLNPLDYNIQVDDITIDKDTHTAAMISNYSIKNSSYSKSYQYDNNGNITRIIYKD